MLPPVVGPDWLAAHLGQVVPADVRWYVGTGAGRDAYDAGHIPGAVFVDLDADLSAPPGPGRHPLPDPEEFAAAMARLGIGQDDEVVGYDDAGGVIAARLVWMLRAGGHSAALLDGGLPGWSGPLETATRARPPAVFTPRPWPAEQLAGLADLADERVVLLDARERERYLGAHEPVDPRAGHIPGAASLPCRDNLDPTGRLLPAEVLRGRLADLGVTDAAAVVSYCGSGVTACHTLLVLEHLGLGRGRLYPGSWSHYCADPARPVATGG